MSERPDLAVAGGHQILVRVVQFFEATDKQDEAARWRTELQAIKSAP